VHGLLNGYPPSVRVAARGPDVLLGEVLPLDNHLVPVGYNPQNPAGGALAVARYDPDHVAFFNV
jgi:hypothetical protein